MQQVLHLLQTLRHAAQHGHVRAALLDVLGVRDEPEHHLGGLAAPAAEDQADFLGQPRVDGVRRDLREHLAGERAAQHDAVAVARRALGRARLERHDGA